MLIFHKRIFRVNIDISIESLFLDIVDPMNQPAEFTTCISRVIFILTSTLGN